MPIICNLPSIKIRVIPKSAPGPRFSSVQTHNPHTTFNLFFRHKQQKMILQKMYILRHPELAQCPSNCIFRN